MMMIRCNLCPFDLDIRDKLFEHIKQRHENHHSGTEQFVMGRFGDRKKRATNRIRGEVTWLKDDGEKYE